MVTKNQLKKFLKGKTILVTGALGSIGSAIVQSLIAYDVSGIKAIDNRETELFYGQKNNNDKRIIYCFADVKDKESLRQIIQGVNIVFHAAAMKHVIVCETHPYEAIKTNIIGTKNMMELCVENNVEKMILISTDKSIYPEGVMGATKLLAERMISATHSRDYKTNTKFGAVRFGNILYSRGSVLEIWDEQLKNNKKITITDPEMTRFIMGIPQSVDLIFSTAYYVNNAEIFIMKMPSSSIESLATAYLDLHGLPKDHYVLTGTVKGDKQHEELLSKEESDFLLENQYFFLKTPLELDKIKKVDMGSYKKFGFKKSKIDNFASNNKRFILGSEKVKEILEKYTINKDLN